jgi:hypothetical protein
MKEHIRKIHKNAGKYILSKIHKFIFLISGLAASPLSVSLASLPAAEDSYHTQVLNELDETGYGWQTNLSMPLIGSADWMAQSWDNMDFAGNINTTFGAFGPFLANGPAPLKFYASAYSYLK